MHSQQNSTPEAFAQHNGGHEVARAQFGAAASNYAASVPHATSDSLSVVRRWVAGARYDSALDIATGPGFTAFAIAPYCRAVTASDISPEMLEQTRMGAVERQLTNISTAIADATQLPFRDAEFQLITCRTAPHHFSDVAAFIAEARRALAPAGKFIVVDTCAPEFGPAREWHHRVELARDPSHVRALTPTEWVSALGDGGFQVVDTASTRVDMTFRHWVERSNTPSDVVEWLEREFATASDEIKRCFRIEEIDGGNDFGFSWSVFSVLSIKPA